MLEPPPQQRLVEVALLPLVAAIAEDRKDSRQLPPETRAPESPIRSETNGSVQGGDPVTLVALCDQRQTFLVGDALGQGMKKRQAAGSNKWTTR